MRSYSFILMTSFICAALIRISIPGKLSAVPETVQDAMTYKKKSGQGCGPNLAAIDLHDSSNVIPLLNGWGRHRMVVTAKDDSANIYFQQGINMYYGFHIIEALASFEKSIRFDENFAMGYWGKALAYGPNINDLGYTASPEALKAIEKAERLSNNCTPVEKSLINAMLARYSADTTQKREYLNQLYADALEKTQADFPNNGDVAALYVDALMVQHPWDYYDRFYNPKPWTGRIVSILEKLVRRFPDNPGVNHYYIHAIEGSGHPEKGLEVADRLGVLMPGVAHLVHMPSHIYIRSGHYRKGIEVNEKAVENYYAYLSKYPLTQNNSFLYLLHNQHMQAACANMGVQYSRALEYSIAIQKDMDGSWLNAEGYFGVYSQYIYMTRFFTLVRFGKWDDVLKAPAVPASQVYSNIIWHFARGMAFAHKLQFENANSALQELKKGKASPQLLDRLPAFNPCIAGVEIAEKILEGTIAKEKGQLSLAVSLMSDAAKKEDEMLYNEPRDWLIPARQYWGDVLLRAKRYAEAEKVYREDLRFNPNNQWSLTGLEQALKKQGQKTQAMNIQDRIKADAGSDIQIVSSVF